MRQVLALLAVATALAGVPAAGAQKPPAVGISDQQWTTLVDPLVTWLGIRHARGIAPWDAALRPSRELDLWLRWAGWSGIVPLVSFERSASDCLQGACRLPAVAEYRDAFVAFRARWPQVTAVSVWNEGNHPGQPTAERPDAAAAYYRAAVDVCPRCRILAAEVVDIPGMGTWLARFQRALGGRPRLWGLHNYGDVTRRQDARTVEMLGAVDGEVWLTETGGLVRFELPDGTVRWPEDEERARGSVEYGFGLADAHADRITRLYLYNWREAPGLRWDSGLLSPGGRLRPSFWALAARLRPRETPPPDAVADESARAGGRARVTRRPRFRRGRVRARVACARAPGQRCSVAMEVRTHAVVDHRGRPRSPRDGRVRLGRDVAVLLPGGSRMLRVRVPRSRLKLIRTGRTRSLLADVSLGGDRPVRYRVRCGRRR